MTRRDQELLRIDALRVDYDAHARSAQPALDGVDLVLHAGETLALVGESGSGKSTLLLAIPGLLPRAASVRGSIRFEGRELLHADERTLRSLRGRRIASLFQDSATALDPVQRIGAALREVLDAHASVARARRAARVHALLVDAGLADAARIAHSFPHQLSGGERQRALLALALANEPALLLADEPTSALDPATRNDVLAHLEHLRAQRGLACMWVTHDLSRAARHAQHVAVLYGGRIVETGPAADVFARPLHPYAAALARAVPSRATSELPRAIPVDATGSAHWPSGCRFRTRCTSARAACAELDPPLVTLPRATHDIGARAVACPFHADATQGART